MKALLLAAGRGSRMAGQYPKCLLSYNGETLLERLIRQLQRSGVDEIIVVSGYKANDVDDVLSRIPGVKNIINQYYESDRNIYSMMIGLEEIQEDVVVFETDMIASDGFISYVVGTDFEDRSVWFTRGKMMEGLYGGMLRTDGMNNVVDIQIVDEYREEYCGYDKLTGVMRIASDELVIYKQFLKEYCMSSISQYYLIPWIENLKRLPCIKGDAQHYVFSTFNTVSEYKSSLMKQYDQPLVEKNIILRDIRGLYPVEEHDPGRLEVVERYIIDDECWVVPIKISEENTVMDGHHSLALAVERGYRKIPVIEFRYDDVIVFSLKEQFVFDKDVLVANALDKRLLPYKTAKHILPPYTYDCRIKLEEIR